MYGAHREYGVAPRSMPVAARALASHAVGADLLRQLGRDAEAADAYEVAIARTLNEARRNHLCRARAMIAS